MDIDQVFSNAIQQEFVPIVENFPESKAAEYGLSLESKDLMLPNMMANVRQTWKASVDYMQDGFVTNIMNVMDIGQFKQLEFRQLYDSLEAVHQLQFMQTVKNICSSVIVADICNTVPWLNKEVLTIKKEQPDINMPDAVSQILSPEGIHKLSASFGDSKVMNALVTRIRVLMQLRGDDMQDEISSAFSSLVDGNFSIDRSEIEDQLKILTSNKEVMDLITGKKSGFNLKDVMALMSKQ